ncbi:unnamed protein product, partial [Aphanomyces euteiches]
VQEGQVGPKLVQDTFHQHAGGIKGKLTLNVFHCYILFSDKSRENLDRGGLGLGRVGRHKILDTHGGSV